MPPFPFHAPLASAKLYRKLQLASAVCPKSRDWEKPLPPPSTVDRLISGLHCAALFVFALVGTGGPVVGLGVGVDVGVLLTTVCGYVGKVR